MTSPLAPVAFGEPCGCGVKNLTLNEKMFVP